MSGVVAIPIVLPMVTPIVWPKLSSAVSAAAGSMGFSVLNETEVDNNLEEVVLDSNDCEEVNSSLVVGENLVFEKNGVIMKFTRGHDGKTSVSVSGHGLSKNELKQIGTEMRGKIMQQYAYHRIVTELKDRNFNMVDQAIDEEGNVRLKVRIYQ